MKTKTHGVRSAHRRRPGTARNACGGGTARGAPRQKRQGEYYRGGAAAEM